MIEKQLRRRDVLTKDDMYERWQAMEFGNRPRSWESFEEWNADWTYMGPVAIRYCEPDSKRKAYGVRVGKVLDTLRELGGEISKYRFSEQSNLDDVVIQGELTDIYGGVLLSYTHANKPMSKVRDTLIDVRGSAAMATLDRWLDPCDAEDLRYLLASYPRHVIEFGSYRRPFGVCHRRMCVWEVRKY